MSTTTMLAVAKVTHNMTEAGKQSGRVQLPAEPNKSTVNLSVPSISKVDFTDRLLRFSQCITTFSRLKRLLG